MSRPVRRNYWNQVTRCSVVFLISASVLAGCSDADEGLATTTSAVSTSAPPITAEEPTTTSVATSTTEPGGQPVDVFFAVGEGADCGAVQAFSRDIFDPVDLYRSTFLLLVAGPSELETAAGAGSFFSAETADVIKSAVLTDGLLRVDFTDIRTLIPNASTSCGSEALLAQLNGTAFQFPEVERTRFLIEGSCGDFANWLQRECFDTDRSGLQRAVPINEQAGGAGCTPASTETLPAGRWYGFIADANADELSFDLACWFTGTAAEAAASENGAESPPPNDYYVRNDSDRLRTHVVDSATQVRWLPEPGNPESAEVVAYATWLEQGPERLDNAGYWIMVEDDSHVIGIEEQFVP